MKIPIFQKFVRLFFIIGLSLPMSLNRVQSIQAGGCLSCHGPFSSKRESFSIKEVQNSIHGDLPCVSCHYEASKGTHGNEAKKVNCQNCHKDEFQSYRHSIHGQAAQKGIKEAPTCLKCHGGHNISSIASPQSPVSPIRLSQTCLSCHKDQPMAREEKKWHEKDFLTSYEQSVHGRLSPETGRPLALCCDCHGSHRILPADDPSSQVYKKNIPADCGSCHPDILKEYEKSIHGVSLRNGNLLAPSCTDCHGEHKITRVTDPQSKVFATNIPTTCSHCHEGEKLSRKFGIPSRRAETYQNSYHGLAIKFGETFVATCSSCHGIHNIRPSSDPLSSIHPDNLPKTCGKCHPGAGEKFKIGKVHIEAKPESSLGTFLVRQFYIWFISLLLIGFLTHIILEMMGRRRERKMRKDHGS